MSEKHKNALIFSYKGKIKDLPFVATQKINHDPIYAGKPAYYEMSNEIWFW